MRMLAIALAALATLAPAAAETVQRRVEVDGQARRYLLHAPPGAEGPLPLVVSFHGAGSNAGQQERYSRLSELADAEGFVVVYPRAGGDGLWDAFGDEADIRFTEAIVAALAEEGVIDPERVFGTGLSLGAQFTFRLACERPALFAAVGLVAGGYPGVCGPERPPAIIFHGTRDRVLPYDGGDGLMPVPEFARGWGGAGCSEHVYGRVEGEGFNAQMWSCGRNRAVLYSITGAGHIYPSARRGGVDASAEMWSFFAANAVD